jgi:hypothetical protein
MSTRKHEDQHLQVEVEGAPGRRLMLGHRGDDWDIVLGVGRIEQRVETTGPRSDLCNSANALVARSQNHILPRNVATARPPMTARLAAAMTDLNST